MRVISYCAVSCLFVSMAHASEHVFEKQIWGDRLFISTPTPQRAEVLKNYIDNRVDLFSKAWDPDCYYRQSFNGLCRMSDAEKQEAVRITKLSQEIKKEASLPLDFALTRDAKTYREFGAIGKGLFLQKLAEAHKDGDWAANFSGDIYVSKKYSGNADYDIRDPAHPESLNFAKVNLRGGGWLFVSGDSSQGTTLRSNTNETGFKMVVLLAGPEFDGAKLDAWATSLILSGHAALKKLNALDRYTGKWAYLIFTKDGTPVCSQNLRCDFNDPKNRSIAFIGRGNVNKIGM